MNTIDDSLWVPVPGYEREYAVHPTGAVRRISRLPGPTKPVLYRGKATVNLSKRGIQKPVILEQLINRVFIKHPVLSDGVFWHLDDDEMNCSVVNLQYVPLLGGINPLFATDEFEKSKPFFDTPRYKQARDETIKAWESFNQKFGYEYFTLKQQLLATATLLRGGVRELRAVIRGRIAREQKEKTIVSRLNDQKKERRLFRPLTRRVGRPKQNESELDYDDL